MKWSNNNSLFKKSGIVCLMATFVFTVVAFLTLLTEVIAFVSLPAGSQSPRKVTVLNTIVDTQKCFWERDFILSLLRTDDNTVVEHVHAPTTLSDKHSACPAATNAVVMVSSHPICHKMEKEEWTDALSKYLERCTEASGGTKPVVIHLSDECDHDWSSEFPWYREVRHLFRQYSCVNRSAIWMQKSPPDIRSKFHKTILPLGFMSGQGNLVKDVRPNFENRKYSWAHIGTMKADRVKMIEHFKRLPSGYPLHRTSAENIFRVYSDSWFVPCGRGWSRLEVFRIYEALYAGAIPVIVGPEKEIIETFEYLGNDLLKNFVVAKSWSAAADESQKLLADPTQLHSRARATHSAWLALVDRLRVKMASVLSHASHMTK